MSLEKTVFVDLIETLANGVVQVRTKVTIFENGAEIGGTFHRHVIAPGEDYSKEDARVKAICKVIHTADTIAAYKTAQAVSHPV